MKIYLFSFISFLIFYSPCYTTSDHSESLSERKRKLHQLKNILFPDLIHKHNHKETNTSQSHIRSLLIRGIDYTAQCPKCNNLKYCSILNNYMVEEVYINRLFATAEEINEKGTCTVIEQLGRRSYHEIFGDGKPFRDEPQCRDMVMQYLCLFWGSNNNMYRNSCVFQEDTHSADPKDHKLAQRPPCRSFCTQIALYCANEYDFINLCWEIACPPTENQCTPDPILKGQVLGAGLACHVPIYSDPYSSSSLLTPSLFGTLAAILSVYLLVFGW